MINQIFNEDCLETMSRMGDNSVDLILTDPPYGIGASNDVCRHSHKTNKKDWDNKIPSDEIFKEIFRVSKHQIIWGSNYFDLPKSKCFLVWDKKISYNFTLAMAELAFCSIDYPSKIFSQNNRMNKLGLHPTEKPLKLMEFCVEFARSRAEINSIYDPFSGSGTTLVVAKSLGLDYIGSELDKDYYEIILKRLSAVQGSLF